MRICQESYKTWKAEAERLVAERLADRSLSLDRLALPCCRQWKLLVPTLHEIAKICHWPCEWLDLSSCIPCVTFLALATVFRASFSILNISKLNYLKWLVVFIFLNENLTDTTSITKTILTVVEGLSNE